MAEGWCGNQLELKESHLRKTLLMLALPSKYRDFYGQFLNSGDFSEIPEDIHAEAKWQLLMMERSNLFDGKKPAYVPLDLRGEFPVMEHKNIAARIVYSNTPINELTVSRIAHMTINGVLLIKRDEFPWKDVRDVTTMNMLLDNKSLFSTRLVKSISAYRLEAFTSVMEYCMDLQLYDIDL
jgi:hypothetical protein